MQKFVVRLMWCSGRAKDDNMGRAITSLGDLDVVAMNWQCHRIWKILGMATGYCPCLWLRAKLCVGRPKYVLMGPKISNVQAGSELLSGHDLDGDGLNDLLVGGDFRVVVNVSVRFGWCQGATYCHSHRRRL